MKSIAILGSSGFIGKSLINYILNHIKIINKIFCISRRVTIISSKNKKIIKIQKNFSSLKKLPNVDGIIYLIRSKNIKETKKNFHRFRDLLNNFKKKPKILYLSSGAIYG